MQSEAQPTNVVHPRTRCTSSAHIRRKTLRMTRAATSNVQDDVAQTRADLIQVKRRSPRDRDCRRDSPSVRPTCRSRQIKRVWRTSYLPEASPAASRCSSKRGARVAAFAWRQRSYFAGSSAGAASPYIASAMRYALASSCESASRRAMASPLPRISSRRLPMSARTCSII